MADELDTLVLKIRADTAALAQDAADITARFDAAASEMGAALRRNLGEEVLKTGADSALRALEKGLDQLIRTGKLGLEDLWALLREIAADMARVLLQNVRGDITGSAGGGGSSLWAGLVTQGLRLVGLPGRAAGGPVVGDRPYLVGENGPELFVPERAGHIAPLRQEGARRVINITVNVSGGGEAAPRLMQRSAQQVARAVRRAVEDA